MSSHDNHASCPRRRLEAWILSKPVSTSISEISSQAGEGDFEENILVSTPNQQVEQVLVVQAQNGVNMASGTATTAPSTAITAPSTAPSTAPLQVAGPSTMEPIVEQLGQDTPSVIQVRTCPVSFSLSQRGILLMQVSLS